MRDRLRATLADRASVVLAYLAIEDEPAPADIIWALGSMDMRVARKAADLYNAGLSPWLVCSGGKGHRWTDLEKAEADLFADEAVAAGVLRDRIIVENTSTNTAENITQSLAIFDARGLDVRSALLVTIPAFQRRASIAVRTHRDSIRCINAPISWGRSDDWDDEHLVLVARLCAGEIHRLQDYPRRGFLKWDSAELPSGIVSASVEIERCLTEMGEPVSW